MIILKVYLIYAISFTAIVLVCAVLIARRRGPETDPFALPFGEMPHFTPEELRRLRPRVDPDDPLRRAFAVRDRLKRETQPLLLIRQSKSAGAALRPDDAGGRGPSQSPRRAAARDFFRLLLRGRRHA